MNQYTLLLSNNEQKVPGVENMPKTEKNLDTKVQFIFKNDNSGKIILSFKSKSDFQRIIKKINE